MENEAEGKIGEGHGKASAAAKPKRVYSYLLEFRCRGRLVYSEKTDDMGELVRIGRSPESDWVIPPEDRSAADFSAQLRLGAREISIVAAKGCQFRFKGKPASQRRLAPGDRIAIGDCELFVSRADSSSDRPCDVHRLEFLNGPRAGEMLRLEKPSIKIGSAADNDIVISDDVVSAHHAELKISPDGETWLRDLSSQNGTFVNGAKMGKSERMIMDSDVISIAFYDLRFLDRNVVHTRTNLSKKFAAVALTALATAAAFAVFYSLTPSSESVLSEYEAHLKNNDFAGARAALKKLPYSRDFKKFAAEYPERREALSRYESVFGVFNDFKDRLKNSDWAGAMACIGLLNLENRVDWNWNEAEAGEYMRQASLAKSYLIAMYSLSNLLADTDLPAERIPGELGRIEKTPLANPELEASAPDYLKPLCRLISEKLADLRKNAENLSSLDKLLNGINWESADLDELSNRVCEIERDSMGGVRVKAQNAAKLLKKIGGNIEQVRLNQRNFQNLKFGEIERDVEFVSADECLNYEAIANLRGELVARNALILKGVDSLSYIISNLDEFGIAGGSFKLAEKFNSRALWERLLSFESLKNPPRAASERGFADEYDKLLGFRYFYDVIAQIPSLSTNLFSSADLLPEQYHPECISLSEAFKVAEEAKAWLSLPENSWMLKDGIAELKGRVDGVLESRGKLLAMLGEIARQNSDGRKFFVAKAAYFYFAPSASVSKADIEDFSQKWTEFRRRQYSLWERYNPMDAESMGEIKREILSEGIPGDPIVNSFWK